MRCYPFEIGGIGISLETDRELEVTEEFAPFHRETVKPKYRALFHRVEEIPPVPREIVSEDLCCRTHPDGKGGFLRSFFNPPEDLEPYSLVTYDYAGGIIDVPYVERGSICVSRIGSCTSSVYGIRRITRVIAFFRSASSNARSASFIRSIRSQT